MKRFIATLLLVGVLGFVGCGEKTTGDKVDDAIESGSDAADDAADKLKKIGE